MDQTENISPEAATDEPASSLSTTDRAPTAVRVSDRLSESLIEDAIEAGGRAQRSDGWTPARIRTFLEMLAQCGVVADAARAAGMSKQSAYAFRNSARGRALDVAWRAALLLARRFIADEVMSRAINGYVEVIMRNGEVWGERHRYDDRLTMAVLTRLDQLAASSNQADEAPACVAEEFEAFVDVVCAGGEEAAAFIHSRCELACDDFEEANIICRNEDYAHSSPGSPGDEQHRGIAAAGASSEQPSQSEWQPSTSSTRTFRTRS